MHVKINVCLPAPGSSRNTLEDDLDAVGLLVEDRMSAGFALESQDVTLKADLTGVSTGFAGGSVPIVAAVLSYVATIDHLEGDASKSLPQLQGL